MTHELKQIAEAFFEAQKKNLKAVLVTVVDLDGSSYRKPGVRMLITEDGKMTGAVSGGCVEKEIWNQSKSVFETGVPLMMTYDGRYRLGCEGVLYILIEIFNPDSEATDALNLAFKSRISFSASTAYSKEVGHSESFGTFLKFQDKTYPCNQHQPDYEKTLSFEQVFPPLFRLVIIGTEHDAVALCKLASDCGWQIDVVGTMSDPKSIENFPGAYIFHHLEPTEATQLDVDHETAIVLMTHSYSKDLNYLTHLKETKPAYLGVIGSTKRMHSLMNELIERDPSIDETFITLLNGPAGLDINAITPQEIGISVIAQIVETIRKKEVNSSEIKKVSETNR